MPSYKINYRISKQVIRKLTYKLTATTDQYIKNFNFHPVMFHGYQLLLPHKWTDFPIKVCQWVKSDLIKHLK